MFPNCILFFWGQLMLWMTLLCIICYGFQFNTLKLSFQVITIGGERYTVGEALFQPSILGLEAHGIVEQLVRCISTVSSDNHKQLLENTVLCGGTASITGEFAISDTTVPCGALESRYISNWLAV